MFFLERSKLSHWEGRREGKGCPVWMQRDASGGSEVIPAPALWPGWRSKMGLLEGLREPQGEESQNNTDEKHSLLGGRRHNPR